MGAQAFCRQRRMRSAGTGNVRGSRQSPARGHPAATAESPLRSDHNADQAAPTTHAAYRA
eukprot:1472380-Alexandrium_andersonii.AAC.1